MKGGADYQKGVHEMDGNREKWIQFLIYHSLHSIPLILLRSQKLLQYINNTSHRINKHPLQQLHLQPRTMRTLRCSPASCAVLEIEHTVQCHVCTFPIVKIASMEWKKMAVQHVRFVWKRVSVLRKFSFDEKRNRGGGNMYKKSENQICENSKPNESNRYTVLCYNRRWSWRSTFHTLKYPILARGIFSASMFAGALMNHNRAYLNSSALYR